jgi:peroxiredoxin
MAAPKTPVRGIPPKPGETAPDFEILESTGALRRLSDLCASSSLVLLFYRGHW